MYYTMDGNNETLVIHPGGLGDVCLSESTFLSLRHRFGDNLRVVGNRRVLVPFSEYFARVDSIDARAWLPLFGGLDDPGRWETIVLVGKDRSGSFRERLQRFTENLIFIEMYPDREQVHVEEYQLGQLPSWGIEPRRKDRKPNVGSRLILYPEDAYQKEKWPAARFLELSETLKEAGVRTVLARPRELGLPVFDTIMPDDLADVAAFFADGGLFFSNDSGMAHFAARCGLFPLTIFADTDPVVWHPITGLVLTCDKKRPSAREAASFILSAIERVGFPRQ